MKFITDKKGGFCILFLLISCTVVSQAYQPHYQKQFQLVTENDAYMLQLHDGYYTNGIFLQYTWLGAAEKKRKVIHTVQLAQKIYNSNHGDPGSIIKVDRPFCGYLYVQYEQTKFIGSYSFFSWCGKVGSIGKSSLGESLQKGYHHLFNFYKPTGWQYQLYDAVEADGFMKAGTTIFKNISNIVSLKPVAQVNAGTTFTGAFTGLYMQLGAFENTKNSVLFEGHLNATNAVTKRNFENFIYFFPRLIVQGYNATIQGGMFRNHKGPVTGNSKLLVYQQTVGWMYSKARFNIGLNVVYETKEAKQQLKNETYGAIRLGYCFR